MRRPKPPSPRRLLTGGLRRVAGLLGEPRDAALVSLADDARALISGREPRGPRSGERRKDGGGRRAYRDAEAAIARGDLDDALVRVERLVESQPRSIRALELRRLIETRRGDLRAQARTLHRLHLLEDTDERHAAERKVVGRWVETTAGWTPRIPGPPRPVEPRPGVVLHLLKESAPYLTNGFTMRSRYNLLAARDAGLVPEVITALGFPRRLGVASVPSLETVDGIRHHRLDLGPHRPLDGPWDTDLRDTAWLAGRVARHVAPSVIHASSGHRGFETALVGLALRDHIDRPLVYEVRSFFEASWSPDETRNEQGEHYSRLHAAETGAMRAADHVITLSESMRADIVARGIAPERIAIVPNGVDAAAFAPEPPDPALRARLGIDGQFVFGYVSNLDHKRENQELLIEATAMLAARGRRVRCLIVGDGKRRTELEAMAKAGPAAAHVTFTGAIPHDEIRRYYAVLDAFVVPRRDERAARSVTPLKPFEAMAMARPLVVSDLPALTEIAAPDQRGLAFPPGDATGLAAALERLIDDAAMARRLGEAGRAWVVTERTWAANGQRLRAIYDEVLERWNARQGSTA
jgi:glycosyltransferase involved in cell wall biosynthesis